MNKVKTSSLMLVLILALIVTGCSSNNNNNNSKPSASAGENGSNNVIKLKFWGAVPEENGPKQAVENWNKANPDIQVEYVRFVNDESGNTKLETALLAGDQVDLFINYRMDKLSKRIDAGMVEPLDSYIEKSAFNVEENFGSNAITKFEDKTYYIPAIILNDFVTLNKSFLDEAGLAIPEQWTWDQYMDYAAKLTKGDGADKRWGSYTDLLQPKIFEYLDKAVKTELGPDAFYKQDGTSNFDNPAFKQYFDIMYNLEKTLKAQPPIAEAKATKMEGIQLYLTNKVAMHWIGTASLRNIKNTTDYPHDFITAFAPPPKLTENSAYLGGGTGYLDFTTINARSQNKDAAWKFMQWYVTEGNEPLIAGGRVPAWKKADKDKVASLILGENPEKLFDVDSFKRVVFANVDYVRDTKFDHLAEIQKIVEEEGERVLIGEKPTADAVKSMKERADKLLKSSK
ncbi:extracellular solute-binding protein [Cohnella herbarum]|uniref:Extracellular solute-binding protein n=1 Tax=Cohnella herbarum TaxID=2728023 RepID=A0A7Z2ZNV1_9BACL|nr:extracellular solute-binding protein [Cohnella herbarum]QJD86195.1 extracellular solute-binding protein [Cohnella herbarum]